MTPDSATINLLNFSNNTRTDSNMYIRDWRKALRSPPTYRIGNTTFRFHFHFAFILCCLCTIMLVFFYVQPDSRSTYSDQSYVSSKNVPYNYTYPFSAPIISNGMITYRIGIIADLDQSSYKSESKNTWRSYYKKGYLSYNEKKNSIAISFDEGQPMELVNHYALNGRGMELSELVTFNGKLLTFDDRTGFVLELINGKVIPWLLLMDGDGNSVKGFKSEWATVKDEVLYVGSMGKEWTTSTGEFQNFDPMYVKAITTSGNVS